MFLRSKKYWSALGFLSFGALLIYMAGGLRALAAGSELTGVAQIQMDVAADAKYDFSHVLGKEWKLIYQGTERVRIELSPEGAFDVRESDSEPGTFLAKLISIEHLKTPFGAVEPITANVVAIATGGGTGTGELLVRFVADDGSVIDVEALAKNPQISEFKLQHPPFPWVKFLGYSGKSLRYWRMYGRGSDPAEVMLTFTYKQNRFKYAAMVPTRDDKTIVTSVTVHGYDLLDLPGWNNGRDNYYNPDGILVDFSIMSLKTGLNRELKNALKSFHDRIANLITLRGEHERFWPEFSQACATAGIEKGLGPNYYFSWEPYRDWGTPLIEGVNGDTSACRTLHNDSSGALAECNARAMDPESLGKVTFTIPCIPNRN